MKKLHLYLLLAISLMLTTTVSAQTLPVNDVSKSFPCLNKNFNLRVVMTVDPVSRNPLLSSGAVDNLLERASEYFSPICLSFSSCDYLVVENYSYSNVKQDNRLEEMRKVYRYPRRITLFIVNKVVGDECGYSYLDGLNSKNEAQIFIERSCADGLAEQIAHHMGTLLGLLDTNEGYAEELVDGSNCDTTGDRICDTPADPYGMVRDSVTQVWIQGGSKGYETDYTRGCEFIWDEVDDSGNYFNPLTRNIMSPYPCKCSFTREQLLRMVENYQANPHLMY